MKLNLFLYWSTRRFDRTKHILHSRNSPFFSWILCNQAASTAISEWVVLDVSPWFIVSFDEAISYWFLVNCLCSSTNQWISVSSAIVNKQKITVTLATSVVQFDDEEKNGTINSLAVSTILVKYPVFEAIQLFWVASSRNIISFTLKLNQCLFCCEFYVFVNYFTLSVNQKHRVEWVKADIWWAQRIF